MSALLHHRHSEHSAPPAPEPVDVEALRAELRNELEAELRPALEAEIRTSMAKDVASSPIPSTPVEEAVSTKEPDEEPATSKRLDADSDPTPKGTSSPKAKPKPTPKPKPKQKPKSKPSSKSGGLFGAKTPKRKYEGPPEGKMDWFLNEALDTVYDPHGRARCSSGGRSSHVRRTGTSGSRTSFAPMSREARRPFLNWPGQLHRRSTFSKPTTPAELVGRPAQRGSSRRRSPLMSSRFPRDR